MINFKEKTKVDNHYKSYVKKESPCLNNNILKIKQSLMCKNMTGLRLIKTSIRDEVVDTVLVLSFAQFISVCTESGEGREML